MEAFTSWHHWLTGPFDIKPVGDRAFAEGMNRVTVHGASHNPGGTGYPGIAYHAGTHYNDKLAWWPKIRPFNDYLGRISYMLQEGSFDSDVLYYYG
ncbi:MAG: glycosyl hydrolase, partial [Desulfovermiculus sp.]